MSSSPHNPESFLPTMSAIAREAGALLLQYFQQGLKIEYKGDADLVTAADRASEVLIRERITQKFPSHDVLGEEQGLNDQGSDYRWYVDPLDGTTNFAHGYPVFCISIGLVRKDEQLEASVLYDPTRDEMFSAERELGATLNGKPIHVSKTTKLAESILGTGFPSHKRHKNPNIHFYQQITLRSHGVRRQGSAALDLAYTACGRFDGYWEFYLNPWDTSAGYLLLTEAGGTMTRFDGSPFLLDSREVLASNGLLHEEISFLFREMFAGRGLDPIPTPAEFAARRASR